MSNHNIDDHPILPETVATLLATHKQWLDTKGQEGTRLVLRGADLSRIDLMDQDLRYAKLQECCLEATCLQGSKLNFADLSNVTQLLPEQLAGADLSGAKLPADIHLIERLEHIEEVTVSGRKVFFIMLLAVAYTWLTIATTSDVDLLTNAATSPLPIILTELPVSGFYWAAPLILLGFYVYFHLHLQRLWEDLAALPAFFPDGRSLNDKVYPWLLTGLITTYSTRLREVRPPLSEVQNMISIVLAWYVIPITLGALWLRYLPRHDWAGTKFHVLCLMFVALAGIVFYRLAVATLSGNRRPRLTARSLRTRWRNPLVLVEIAVLSITFVLLPILSYGALKSGLHPTGLDPRSWVPKLISQASYNPFADFSDRDVSTRPVMWSEDRFLMEGVMGANLKAADLHHLNASGAFMMKADLRKANLQAANLELTDLRQARLQDADLRQVNLLQSDLREASLNDADLREAVLLLANLEDARLRRVDLRRAFLNQTNLRSADLFMADLRDAHLADADLRQANLTLAIFGGTNLQGADLREVVGIEGCGQLQSSLLNEATRLPEGLQCKLNGKN